MFDNQKEIRDAWHEYIEENNPVPAEDPRVRQIILDSWRRSQGKSDPYQEDAELLSPGILSSIMKHNHTLVDIVMPYITHFYNLLRGLNHQILLTDARGHQLFSVTDDDELSRVSAKTQVLTGCTYSEQFNGTNGISLCLKENAPVSVFGYEHYRAAFHDFVCYAAPLHNPSGSVIGVLCIMGLLKDYREDMLNMMMVAAEGIENELRLTQSNCILETVLDLTDKGIIVLDEKRNIMRANAQAGKILNVDSAGLASLNLNDVIDPDSLPPHLFDEESLNDTECTLLMNGRTIHADVRISRKHAAPAETEPGIDLLVIESQETANTQVSRIAGFTAAHTFDSIAGSSQRIQNCIQFAKMIANSDANALITGEHGVGKEMFAQAIHNASGRRDGPFISINCGSLPQNSINAELFGYEPSFYSGRLESAPGRFELANGGTIFLNDVDCLSRETQDSLAHILQSRTVTRMGGTHSRPVNVRVLSSSTRNIAWLTQSNEFSPALFYELSVLNLTIPPLRDRISDMDELIRSEIHLAHPRVQLPPYEPEVMDALQKYSWPGNIRELVNTVEYVLAVNDSQMIRLTDLPQNILDHYYTLRYVNKVTGDPLLSDTAGRLKNTQADIISPEMKEYNMIIDALKKEHGHVKTVALLLGIPVSTLYRKLSKYNIDARDYKVW